MGKRLAESGYAVLTVNPFYRTQKAPTAPPNPNFGDPATREALLKLAGAPERHHARTPMRRPSSPGSTRRPQVDKRRKIGTTGYCMGGPIVMRTRAARAGSHRRRRHRSTAAASTPPRRTARTC